MTPSLLNAANKLRVIKGSGIAPDHQPVVFLRNAAGDIVDEGQFHIDRLCTGKPRYRSRQRQAKRHTGFSNPLHFITDSLAHEGRKSEGSMLATDVALIDPLAQ